MKLFRIFQVNALIACLLVTTKAAIAVSSPTIDNMEALRQSWTVSIYFENDLFSGRDEDYTNGAKITWISRDLNDYRQAGQLPDWAYNALDKMPIMGKRAQKRNVALSIGQNMYTPQDVLSTELIENDRPYAAWLYFGIGLHNHREKWLDTLEVNLGVVGPLAFGREAQNFVHSVRDIYRVKGWHHQIRNEPAINFVFERKFRHRLLGDLEGWGVDSILHGGGSLGNVYTYANTGATLRMGWNLPQDFGAALIRLAGDSNAPSLLDDLRFRDGRAISLHAFFGFDGRAVARDITLDGNTFRDSHSIPKNNWVADRYWGFGFIAGRWKISYAHIYRTRAYQGGRDHNFGSINISYTR